MPSFKIISVPVPFALEGMSNNKYINRDQIGYTIEPVVDRDNELYINAGLAYFTAKADHSAGVARSLFKGSSIIGKPFEALQLDEKSSERVLSILGLVSPLKNYALISFDSSVASNAISFFRGLADRKKSVFAWLTRKDNRAIFVATPSGHAEIHDAIQRGILDVNPSSGMKELEAPWLKGLPSLAVATEKTVAHFTKLEGPKGYQLISVSHASFKKETPFFVSLEGGESRFAGSVPTQWLYYIVSPEALKLIEKKIGSSFVHKHKVEGLEKTTDIDEADKCVYLDPAFSWLQQRPSNWPASGATGTAQGSTGVVTQGVFTGRPSRPPSRGQGSVSISPNGTKR